jgi:hypothetical protein
MNQTAAMPVGMAQDFMKDINNFDAVLARFEMDLRRQEVVGYDDKGAPVIKNRGEPRLSEEGIRDLVGEMRVFLSPNTSYSYLTEDQFNREMKQIAITTDIKLFRNMILWGISEADYRPLCTIINTFKSLAMRKAIGKNYQDFTSSTKSTVENRIIEEKPGGLLGMPWGNSQKKQY